MPPRVTVIMRTKNADWVVAQALASLFSQNFTDFTLSVVDSGSTDRTLDIVSSYPCTLTRIDAGSYYPGAVLNDAIENSDTDIVVFQNSDVALLSPDALENLVKACMTPGTVAAFARQIPRPEADTWVRRDYAKSFPPDGTAPPWIALSLPFAAMRKDAWEHHHFYTDAWASEDTEWGEWARRNNHHIAYVPDAPVMHSHNYTLRQIYGRRFVEGEADAFIYAAQARPWRHLRDYCESTARDLLTHAVHGDVPGFFFTPVRLAVYQYAHYRGMALGAHRRATHDTDTTRGQKTVLSRYEP